MLLESILYFVLGFLCAALLALMVSPAIWNRAVILTKRKIESSVPLTLNEIQADKDQLRAEFAMSTRRLEMSIDDLRDKASSQLVEINRRRDEVNKLDQESRTRLSELTTMEKKASDLTAKLNTKEGKLSDLTERYDQLVAEHQYLSENTRKLESRYSDAEQTLKSREVELSASSATIEALKGTVSAVDMSEDQRLSEIRDLQHTVSGLKEQLAEAQVRSREIQTESDVTKRELLEARNKIEDMTKKSVEDKENKSESRNDISELTSQLIQEKANTVDLEAKLARQAIQTEALLNDASNENVQKALKGLKADLDEKSDAVRTLRAERDQISQELESIKATATDSWSDERQEKALLRERINDLAAQVAAMTANLEGKDSPIKKILKDTSSTNGNLNEVTASKGKTLADRIRAIQQDSAS